MFFKPLIPLLALSCLLALPINSQPLPATQSLSLPTKTSNLKAEKWPQNLRWQKAPDGNGEFLPYPNTPDQEEFVWGKRRFVGTRQGLLYSDSKDQWQIVPALYNQPVNVAGESQNLLWLDSDALIGDQGLIALNHKLEVVLRLPTVKGRCIAIEPQGFWCLEGRNDGFLMGGTYRTLVEYDLHGKEKRRLEYTFISWASVDSDAVWLSIHNTIPVETYPFPSLSLGRANLGRLDRSTGKFTIIPWTPPSGDTYMDRGMELMFNSPQYIQWLKAVDRETTDIYQMDKRTLKATRVMRFPLSSYSLRTQGKNLWSVQSWGEPSRLTLQAYSRETLNPVPLDKAGTPPVNEYFIRPNNWDPSSSLWFWLGIVGDDESGVWLSAPAQKLLHLGDDGNSVSYQVDSVLWSTRSPSTSQTPPGQFLWLDNEQLVQIQSDGQTKRLLLGGKWPEMKETDGQYLQFLAATKERIWYFTNDNRLVTLTPELSAPREIIQKPLFGTTYSQDPNWLVSANRGSIAVGNDLYFWDGAGLLYRIDGTTGQVSVVSSCINPAPDKRQASPRDKFAGRIEGAFALPDGRIAFKFAAERGPEQWGPGFGFSFGTMTDDKPRDKAHFFIFDPVKDTWQESGAAMQVIPLRAGKNLFGYDEKQLYQWQGDKWAPIAKRPILPPTYSNYTQDWRTMAKIASTEKYLYQETALGLYRIPWAQIGG